jgi:hypothetical protein
MGFRPSSEELAELIEEIDEDGSGAIEFPEFAQESFPTHSSPSSGSPQYSTRRFQNKRQMSSLIVFANYFVYSSPSLPLSVQ